MAKDGGEDQRGQQHGGREQERDTRPERRRCWATRRRPGPVTDVLALHSTAVKPTTHADLGRACFGSARALDAGEPFSEEGAQEFWLLVG